MLAVPRLRFEPPLDGSVDAAIMVASTRRRRPAHPQNLNAQSPDDTLRLPGRTELHRPGKLIANLSLQETR